MEMYTEIYVNVDLKEDTPEEVIYVLRSMVNHEELGDQYPARWKWLFRNSSYYTPRTSCSLLTWDEIGNQWSLLGKGDIQNYGEEIEKFFSWISPYVDGDKGDFIGYMRYEEDQRPLIICL